MKDIADGCGLTRQAFYYHFKDKYDLMNWIYYTEIARFMTSYSFVGMIVRWANNGMKEGPVEYMAKMRSLFDGSIL